MKKEIPLPVIIVAVLLVLGVGGYFLWSAGSTQEFPAPAAAQVIPRAIFESMPKASQDKMLADGIKVVDDVQGAPAGVPAGVPGAGTAQPGAAPPAPTDQ